MPLNCMHRRFKDFFLFLNNGYLLYSDPIETRRDTSVFELPKQCLFWMLAFSLCERVDLTNKRITVLKHFKWFRNARTFYYSINSHSWNGELSVRVCIQRNWLYSSGPFEYISLKNSAHCLLSLSYVCMVSFITWQTALAYLPLTKITTPHWYEMIKGLQ